MPQFIPDGFLTLHDAIEKVGSNLSGEWKGRMKPAERSDLWHRTAIYREEKIRDRKKEIWPDVKSQMTKLKRRRVRQLGLSEDGSALHWVHLSEADLATIDEETNEEFKEGLKDQDETQKAIDWLRREMHRKKVSAIVQAPDGHQYDLEVEVWASELVPKFFDTGSATYQPASGRAFQGLILVREEGLDAAVRGSGSSHPPLRGKIAAGPPQEAKSEIPSETKPARHRGPGHATEAMRNILGIIESDLNGERLTFGSLKSWFEEQGEPAEVIERLEEKFDDIDVSNVFYEDGCAHWTDLKTGDEHHKSFRSFVRYMPKHKR